MKFLTVKRFVALALVLVVGVIGGIYLFAGVKPVSVNYNNIKFDETGFIDFTSSGGVAGTGFKFQRVLEDGSEEDVVFDNNKKIGENDLFLMYLDEETTIVSIVEKATSKVIYKTATNDKNKSGANITVRYARKSNGKLMDTGLDSLQYSVAFENSLTGEFEKHYKIKYLEDDLGNADGIQLLYSIGKFSANRDYFPKFFESKIYNTEDPSLILRNAYSLEEIIGGNTILTSRDTEYMDGTTPYKIREYTGTGRTYSADVARYLEENMLATVTEEAGYWDLTDVDPELHKSYGVHINSEDSPIEINPFISTLILGNIYSYYGIATIPYKSGSSAETVEDGRQVWKHTAFNSIPLTNLYNYLYTSSEETYIKSKKRYSIYDEDMNPIISGGYHAKDENGKYMYDGSGKPVQELFTLEKVGQINSHFKIESSTSLERFQVGLQIKLTKDGISASIMAETLRDSDHRDLDSVYDHGFLMRAIEVLPELTTSRDTTAEGMMVIPDGSGAIINFNNKKAEQNYTPYSSSVYGADKGFIDKREAEQTKTLMFGMYGFLDITNQRGLMTVADKGAAQSILYADTPRGSSNANYIYYVATVRQNESVVAGSGWNQSSFMKWAQKLNPTDLEYNYIFLEPTELSYVGLANKYREYLFEKFNLEENDKTTTNLVDLNFLGAFERYALFLGVKYMKDDSLTTFSQAIEIIEELKGNNVSNINVGFQAWTNKEFEYETTAKLKVSKVLGGTKGLKKLNNYLTTNNINFYPEMYVATSKGYDYSFGNIKYTAKSVGNFYATQYPFNLATLEINKKLNPTHFLNPKFYNPIAENLFKSYSKFNIDGAYLKDLGNFRLGSYNKGNEIYAGMGELYQIQALDYIQSQVSNLKLSAPFDYAFPYVQTAVDVPLTSSTFGIFDATIPFYQLVASGLFDYTTETVNGTSDKSSGWYLAKALETGSNLQFLVSYTDPEVLLETDYTQYYKSFYENWKDVIIQMNTDINAVNIHGGRLTNHITIAKDVAKVTYSHGLTIVVNGSSINYDYEGIIIPSYGYIVI